MKEAAKRIIALMLAFVLILPCAAFADGASDITFFYVAKNGKDTNAGTIDAPFASVEKARDAVRAAKAGGTLGKDGAVVYIREGEYYIENSIEFTAQDSGTENAPIVYRSYPDEKVSFVGAATIEWSNFKKVTDQSMLNRIVDTRARENVVAADLFALGFTNLPELTMPGTYSYHEPMPEIHGRAAPTAGDPELVVNGKAMTVARYPNNEYINIYEVIENGATPRNWLDTHIGTAAWVAPEDRKPDPFTISFDDERVTYWGAAKDAYITGLFYYSWASQTVPVESFNPAKRTVTSKYPSFYGVLAGQPVYVYNLIEEIDVPGEYYIDRQKGMVYLYPPEGSIDVVAYTTLDDYMLRFTDAEHIKVKGIDMSYMRSGAVFMNSGTKNCELVDSEINYTGKMAVMVNGYDNKIYDCYIHDIEGGVELNGGDRNTLTPGNNVVENCEITRADRISKTYVGAASANGVGNHIVYNKIHDADHTIVRFYGNDHVISFNEIYDACQYADDMGAIYTGRDLTCRGNIISHNYIHDIGGTTLQGGQGILAIFLDDWFSTADIFGNVIENIEGAGIRLAGSHNKIYNNIFINNTVTAAQLNRSYNYGNADNDVEFRQRLAAVPYTSDVWVEKYPEIVNVVDESGKLDMNNNIVAKNNVLINTPKITVSAQIGATATIEDNVNFAGDPGFYDFENKNYLLKPDSDVYEQIEDFEPVYFTRMGMYSDRAAARAKDAHVYCAESPYTIEKGEKKKGEGYGVEMIDGEAYVSLRSGIAAIDGSVDFVEETGEVKVSTGTKSMGFINGEKNAVTLNGVEHTLKAPIVNKNQTNYISLGDLTEMFEAGLIESGDIYILSKEQGLFNPVNDAGLLRYLEEQLTVY